MKKPVLNKPYIACQTMLAALGEGAAMIIGYTGVTLWAMLHLLAIFDSM